MKEIIPNVSLMPGTKGSWTIKQMVKEESFMDTIELMKTGRYVPPGKYTMLYRDRTLVMSDTPDEKRDHMDFVRKAQGNILIAGLGLGMVLQACLLKPEVTQVTVIEISQDLIDLVKPHYDRMFPCGKFAVICADIFDWKPPKNERYNCAWFDIWDDLCPDSLSEMAKLHRKFGKRVDWQGSWGKEFISRRR